MGNATSWMNVLVAGAAFALVLSLWLIGMTIWSRLRAQRAQRIQDRLGLPPDEAAGGRVLRLWHDGQEATTTVGGPTSWPSLIDRVRLLHSELGWKVTLQTFLMVICGVVLLLFVLTFAHTRSIIAGLGVAVAVGLVIHMYLRHCINKRAALFERQFLDAMQIAVRSLRAGHPLIGAFRFTSEEINPPVGELFGNICQEQSLGVSLEEAIRKVADRTTSADMKLFATSVVVQLRSGGNLTDMMDRLSAVIRDRIRVTSRLRVLTAQTQFSKWILIAMPFILFGVLNLVNPNYMRELYTNPYGKLLMAAAGTLLLLGIWIMNRLATIRF